MGKSTKRFSIQRKPHRLRVVLEKVSEHASRSLLLNKVGRSGSDAVITSRRRARNSALKTEWNHAEASLCRGHRDAFFH